MYNEFYDRYEIIRELSCSRHSKVYLVRHRILDVYRVAKIFSGNQYEADRLLKEAHLIKNLKHPHIPVIYDIEQNIGEDNSSICIIEEYIYPFVGDVMEWWLIDSWLAERLKREGEVIIEEYGCCWWGRLASGQSVCMDSVIRKIAGE